MGIARYTNSLVTVHCSTNADWRDAARAARNEWPDSAGRSSDCSSPAHPKATSQGPLPNAATAMAEWLQIGTMLQLKTCDVVMF